MTPPPLLVLLGLLLGPQEPDPLRQPDPSGPGRLAYADEDAVPRRVVFLPADPGMVPRSAGEHEWTVRHESDPDHDWDPTDALGRPVTFDPPRWEHRPDGETRFARGVITIRGGMTPARWREAERHAREFVGPPDPLAVALVARGLAAPRYATRRAAQDVLVRRGEPAIPALLGGLQGRDFEVRDRSRMALDEIHIGPGGPR